MNFDKLKSFLPLIGCSCVSATLISIIAIFSIIGVSNIFSNLKELFFVMEIGELNHDQLELGGHTIFIQVPVIVTLIFLGITIVGVWILVVKRYVKKNKTE